MELAADAFSNHGCNDLDKEVLAMLSDEQKQAFTKEYKEWNGDPEDSRDFEHLGDSSVMSFLAHKLKGNYTLKSLGGE